MNMLFSMLLGLSLISSPQLPGTGPRSVSRAPDWSVTLYARNGYEGAKKTYKAENPDVGADWSKRVKSAVIIGNWELCSKPNYAGECRKLRFSIANLEAWQFPGKVRSLRPVSVKMH